MKKVCISVVLVLLVICPLFAQKQPNIVYIFVDDLGYGDVQANYPKGKIPTPNIDQLALEGIRFTDAHSGASVCSPSRYGLLTGRQFAREDWDGKIGSANNACMIEPQQVTVAEYLKEKGYHTACIGKWHLGQAWYSAPDQKHPLGNKTDYTVPTSDGPNDQGFDYFFGLHGASTSSPYTYMRNRLVTVIPTEKGRKGKPAAPGWDFSAILATVTDEALQYIDQRAEDEDTPFFLYFPLTSVHTPIFPGKDWQGKSEVGWYGDFVMETDWVVGEVLKRLKKHGIDDNTVVIFSSDNGSHGRSNPTHIKPHNVGSAQSHYGHDMNGAWRGVKGDMYEGGHRIPMIIKWPEIVKPASVNHELVMVEDFYATLADYFNDSLNEYVAEDSYSILPYLKGETPGKPIRSYAVLNTFFGYDFIRCGDWVYAPFEGSGGPYSQLGKGGKKSKIAQEAHARGQLYNLKTDPKQENNLWEENHEKVKELSAMLRLHLEQGHSIGIRRSDGADH
ncbi:sulfatase family protein [Carboxylicivirga sp. RSCT41]|uniref:sulfatase family protein n=1 Tax=Carboxylicivirga agarovorans TaxID=3417570 RepID=UPI003D35676D